MGRESSVSSYCRLRLVLASCFGRVEFSDGWGRWLWGEGREEWGFGGGSGIFPCSCPGGGAGAAGAAVDGDEEGEDVVGGSSLVDAWAFLAQRDRRRSEEARMGWSSSESEAIYVKCVSMCFMCLG